ncbi:Legume lectin domain [Dillenia turbinata]|uniref:non-specific serine/threonine protein kinase n=1 Tax=Dillenia turbinata TaxID=194707 RepID=A0AAN8V1N6_9MAGN
MAFSEKISSHLSQILVIFALIIPNADSIFFNFSSFQPNMPTMLFQRDAFVSSGGVIQLTKNQLDSSITDSVGRASYSEPIRLWDAKTGQLTDFKTHFTFTIKAVNPSYYGDGLSFFISPFGSQVPDNSSGGFLGLFNSQSALNSAKNSIVAVEFDSFQNDWDPSSDHVGINVNSIVSVANVTWNSSIKDGRRANAWVWYNSSTFNLSVFLTYADDPVFSGNSSLWYIIDLKTVLPEFVRVGFSAATGSWVEIHNIIAWSFNSTLEVNAHKSKIGLVIGIAVSFAAIGCGVGIFGFLWLGRRLRRKNQGMQFDLAIENEFAKGTGPKRFTYHELSQATNNFAEEGKLGEGGFGGVYRGLLSDSNTEVAVKRVSRGSKQGKKEYISEVMIISRLRHRNLVQLIGWCHEQDELLLVYEYMTNGSLDLHLFGKKMPLTWTVRYKIALGLASSLLYLHEEWEQCVVHRDVKSSNVMLDSNFNAKLGDFGLARLVDHDLGSQTTVLAGTMGYLAPECVTTGKASKESDVYSFGVVALEIACGRRPVDAKAEPSKVRLVEWVWDLYGRGKVLEAADKSLKDYDERQVERLMVVGLWCCHPDYTYRPSIRQVINVLNFESSLPNLPSKLPVPMYFAPSMHLCKFSYTSTGLTNFEKDHSPCSDTCTTSSSQSGSSSKALLYSNTTNMEVYFKGDPYVSGEHVVERNQLDGNLYESSGRVVYGNFVKLWDRVANETADFVTHCHFIIKRDGLAFFMASPVTSFPDNSTGFWLGLFNSLTNDSYWTKVVDAEIDTFKDDHDADGNHVGINVNSINSVTSRPLKNKINGGEITYAMVSYNSASKSLFVNITQKGDFGYESTCLLYDLDLRQILPEQIIVGFSASTGNSTELHKILSWNFNSTTDPARPARMTMTIHRSRAWLILFVVVIILSVAFSFSLLIFQRRDGRKNKNEDSVNGDSLEEKFGNEMWPRRFTYKVLVIATNKFNEKLGQGGFGGVYRGP